MPVKAAETPTGEGQACRIFLCPTAGRHPRTKHCRVQPLQEDGRTGRQRRGHTKSDQMRILPKQEKHKCSYSANTTESQEGWNSIDNKVTPTRRIQRKPRNQGEHITPRNHEQAERKPLKTTRGHKTDSSKCLGHKPPTWAPPPTDSPAGEDLGAGGGEAGPL